MRKGDIIILKCSMCGKEFIGYKTTKYCSTVCKNKASYITYKKKLGHEPAPDVRKCKYCDKEFKPRAINHLFCSAECNSMFYYEDKTKNMSNGVCAICGKSFERKTSDIKYCSYDCRREANRIRSKRYRDENINNNKLRSYEDIPESLYKICVNCSSEYIEYRNHNGNCPVCKGNYKRDRVHFNIKAI